MRKPYGGGRFVSVYRLSDAEKVKLQATEGISSTGNAKGKVRGIYGINNPVLVIDYGSFESAATKLEEVSSTAYFDLQSGRLNQIIKFN